jgi:hypothetical protein
VKFSVRPSIRLNHRECSPLGVNEGVNFTPRGQISPLGARGEVKNGPQTFVFCLAGKLEWRQCPIFRRHPDIHLELLGPLGHIQTKEGEDGGDREVPGALLDIFLSLLKFFFGGARGHMPLFPSNNIIPGSLSLGKFLTCLQQNCYAFPQIPYTLA